MTERTAKRRGLTRRDFLRGAAALGGLAFVAPLFTDPLRQIRGDVWSDTPHGTGGANEDYGARDLIYTTCEQCNAYCTIKAVVQPGLPNHTYTSLVRKISGNPYSPLTTEPYGPLAYATPIAAAAKGRDTLAIEGSGYRGGRACLKGQAGIQTAYDVMRVRTPLKRVGPRGSEKWISISWDQALDEITQGSPDLGTPGLKTLWAFVSKDAVMADQEKVKKGELSKEEFRVKYQDTLIDPAHPDLGPKSNQIACLGGNRRDFVRDRIWFKGLGSINFDDHGGACGANSVIGTVRSFTGTAKPKKRLFPDLKHAEFIIVWGSNPIVANRGPVWMAPMITNAIARGMKMAVVDPRMSKTAEKAHFWVPVQPGGDGPLALGMGRWIIEQKRFDERYLRNPNKKAAAADNEPTWSDATHLVAVSNEKRPKLRAAALGIGTDKQFVVMQGGKPVPHDQAQEADLEVDTVVNGIAVKSAFTLYKERVMERTLAEYAALSGLDEEQIISLAREFTAHGKRSAILAYRGPAMHANGYYAVRAINALNHLIGNHDWKGGSMTGGARHSDLAGRYDLLAVPKPNAAWGVPISRRQSAYEQSTLFQRDKGYPARRPWFSAAGNSSSEVIPSAAEAYPYGLKALFFYRMSPVLTYPGGNFIEETLRDQSKLPLVVALDIVIGDSSKYADYILPDQTYLERWGRKTVFPNVHTKVSHFIQPVTRVFPEPRPVEDVFIDLLKRMGLPGVGERAFKDGSALHRAEDFYLKLVANIAYADEPVPDANAEELALFEESRSKALGRFFDVARWREAVKPEEWAKVVYVMNRGGRFEPPANAYVGDHLKYQVAAQASFYDEITAGKRHSFTGAYFDGLPRHEAVRSYDFSESSDALPLQLINWKSRTIGQHRGIGNVWLREIKPEHYLWMNPLDARARQIKSGDRVTIRSVSAEVQGHVLLTEGIRPGTVGAAYNYGHTVYGAIPAGMTARESAAAVGYGHTPFRNWEPLHEEMGLAGSRTIGFSVNKLLKIDPALRNAGLVDSVAGGVAQFDTRVEVSRA